MNYFFIDQFDHDHIMDDAQLLHLQHIGHQTIKVITHRDDDLTIIGPIENGDKYMVIDGNSQAYGGSVHDHVRYCAKEQFLAEDLSKAKGGMNVHSEN
ncbi:hypothetical protein R0381_001773 [Jeongeupia wiesaeckerbachi]|uniref:hypothetical protein n=1 Tax=Jeongeupia wiesaeckerbachi TaxID=3051218 RepID=UPI003D809428